MQEVLKRRMKQQLERIETAKQFIQRLRPEIGPLTAWVYGSVAKGTFKNWSDIDIFIVAKNLPEHPLRRLEVIHCFASFGVEPKAWTLDEFLSKLKRNDKQLLAMLSERILLVDELNLEPIVQAEILESQCERTMQ